MLKTLAVERGLLSPAGGVGCGGCRGSLLSRRMVTGMVCVECLVPLNQLGCCSSPLDPQLASLPTGPAIELGSVDEGLRRRMLEMFRPAGEPAAPLSGSAAILGSGGGQAPLPSLHAVIVELDGRFITETTHTAALFAELFPPGGRKRLVKVRGAGREGRWQHGMRVCYCSMVGEWCAGCLLQPAWPVTSRLRLLSPLQMVRECFARYLKLTRRALSDASAIAAATAAGISTSGELVQPLEEALRAAELAAEEEAQGYGSGGAASALEESIAAGGLLLVCRRACSWNGSSMSA